MVRMFAYCETRRKSEMLALLLPLTLAAPQSVDHSVLHPADSLVYFEMTDVQGVYRAYEGTAYGQALADPECRVALEKLLKEKEGAFSDPAKAINRKLDLFTDGYWSLLHPVLSEIEAVSFSVSLQDLPPAALFEGLENDGFWSDDILFSRIETSLRVQVVVDLTSEVPAGMAFGALGQAVADGFGGDGIVVGEGVYEGRPVGHIFARNVPGSKMPAGVFQDGRRIVLAMGADPILFLEAGKKRTDKVTTGQRFLEGQKRFKDQSAGITVFQFKSRLAESFYGVCPEKEYILPAIDLLVSVLGPDFDMLLRGGDWRVQLRDGVFVTESFQEDLELGPFDRLFSGKPLNSSALDYVHKDAVIASGISVDTDLLVGLLKSAFADLDEDPFEEWRLKYDFRPEEDLLAQLGATWVTSLPFSSVGATSLPGLSLWVDLKDRSAFMAGMEKLVQVVNAEAGDEVEAKGKTYRRHRLYTFKIRDASGPEVMLQPTVVVFEDRILVSVSRSRAQTEIKRALAATDEVTAHQVFNSNALTEGFTTVELSYADWAKFLGRLYMGAKSILPMVAGGIPDEIPVDLNALPRADLFTQFFTPAVRSRERVAGGLVMHSTSSFGPEMSGVIAGSMLAGAFFFIPMRVVSEYEEGEGLEFVIEPLEETQHEPSVDAPVPVEPEAPK
ncbi:MAG: hypothetical protein ACI87O_001521 [Planctomycetota bacterium]|jgi:hypothetical protein